MARKNDIRYINHYIAGTAAPNFTPQPERRKNPLLPKPRARDNRELVLQLDPVAIAGIAVAAVLFILMSVGVNRLYERQAEVSVSVQYLEQLKAENLQLKDTYTAGYDLKEIEEIANAMGMVPKDELVREEIHVAIPQAPKEPSRWENFWSFVTGLFA